jgi:cyclopropane fatty-acyl-phospholipid synthase-like methyltransferase
MKVDYAKEYGKMHRSHHGYFPGRSLSAHLDGVKRLVKLYRPKRLLDYGCGKGLQYTLDKMHKHWGGPMPELYDIGYKPYAKCPEGPFDGIICTDVLEHIHEDDLPEVLTHIFSLLVDPAIDKTPFVFFSVSCRPAKKTFADGTNVHLTVKHPVWWQDTISPYKKPGVHIVTAYMGARDEDD